MAMPASRFCCLLLTLIVLVANPAFSEPTNSETSFRQGKNRLGEEKSPYLLQHKNNPIHWFAWGEEAFAIAKKEKKPVFLSIGYSSCYWCHVMEKDSFENEDVAKILNQNFIAIKVDREERPDVDKLYMDAVNAISGRGGWPLSVFLTPEKRPFFGATFFPRKQFLKLLTEISSTWHDDSQKISSSAEVLLAHLKEKYAEAKESVNLNSKQLQNAFAQIKKRFDSEYGGFGRAPKFPPSAKLSLLLRMHRRSKSPEALEMALRTLDEMAQGGMYDHLGGGFHRYSTDRQWRVPHFEKMLYDNALLAWTYLEAYQLSKDESYKKVAEETLNYVLREMTGPQGGFYSAQDAGEVGKEGEYYVWKDKELKELLNSKDYSLLAEIFDITPSGNFEHGQNILYLRSSTDWLSAHGESTSRLRQKLLDSRSKRRAPFKDDKILSAWNGLMISAMAKGFQITGNRSYLEAAERSAQFIKDKVWKNGKLLRRYRDGEARHEGNLDDYAYLIRGLLDLAQSNFEHTWLDWAISLQKTQDSIFWDTSSPGYIFSNPKTSDIPLTKKEFSDNARPSSNAISALNLIRLYGFTFNKEYMQRAKELLEAISPSMTQHPLGHATALLALDYFLDRKKEVAVVGYLDSKSAKQAKEYLNSSFLPNKVMFLGKPSSIRDTDTPPILRGKQAINKKTTFYVCEDSVCKLPTNDLEKAKTQINDFNKLPL